MRYRLIGIDFDGTLLGREGHISPRNRAAIAQAHAQGVLVVPCTGRCWQEARRPLAELNGEAQTGVFVTGAAVCDIATGRVRDTAELTPDVAADLVHDLADAPESVLLFRNRERVGHDYLVTGHGRLTENTRWWFTVMEVPVAHRAHPGPQDLKHVLRVGMVAPASYARPKARQIAARYGQGVTVHSFQALHMPDQVDPLDVLEVFAGGVDKWRGLAWLAAQHGIAAREIAVIGDEINDISMMRQAGCGIAMGNAVDSLKSAARYVTADCDHDGVAQAIECLLAGTWG